MSCIVLHTVCFSTQVNLQPFSTCFTFRSPSICFSLPPLNHMDANNLRHLVLTGPKRASLDQTRPDQKRILSFSTLVICEASPLLFATKTPFSQPQGSLPAQTLFPLTSAWAEPLCSSPSASQPTDSGGKRSHDRQIAEIAQTQDRRECQCTYCQQTLWV